MSLEAIAKMMRHQAELDGVAEQTLSGGLHLVLKRESKSQWSLTLGRRDIYPDAKEQAITRRYFGVPKKAQGQKVEAGGYKSIRLAWSDNDESQADEQPEQLKLM